MRGQVNSKEQTPDWAFWLFWCSESGKFTRPGDLARSKSPNRAFLTEQFLDFYIVFCFTLLKPICTNTLVMVHFMEALNDIVGTKTQIWVAPSSLKAFLKSLVVVFQSIVGLRLNIKVCLASSCVASSVEPLGYCWVKVAIGFLCLLFSLTHNTFIFFHFHHFYCSISCLVC